MAVDPSDLNDLTSAVLAAVANTSDTPAEELRSDLELVDLGLDSLDLLEVLMQVEEATDSDIPADLLDALTQLDGKTTVRDLVGILLTWKPPVDAMPAGMTEQVIVVQQDDGMPSTSR